MSQPVTTNARHPRGLYVLFFTEMWERFGYYLMVGILFLYLRDPVSGGGFGMDTSVAAGIVGTYVALIYLTPFIGGLLADRYLGYRKSIYIGGSLMALGYFLIAIHGSTALLYLSLTCVIIGNGFFKPNISTLLGNMYNKEELKSKKDTAYNIFYMGINIGAFICNFVAAYLRHHYAQGWGLAFSAAGFGMVLSMIFFASGLKHVKHADVIKPVKPEDMPISKIVYSVFLPAIVAGAIGWFIPGNIMGSDSNDAFIFACLPIIYFYFTLWSKA
ncbi:MAG TPA: oligopeptide:H+ symporter, partial [Chitinophagaceae bacterium]|nr:oligopeptide:H+ symporter [Chitinophagaceae bacterium]